MTRWAFAILMAPSLAFGADLAGTWEIQSMGGDREVQIQQRGDTIIAHRVLWPEFEGERYKLEHLFRGKIDGESISGDLLVKEEGFEEYEILRRFSGTISSHDRITLDGNPMKRIGGGIEAPASEKQPAVPAKPAPSPPGAPAARPSPPTAEPRQPQGSLRPPPPGAALFDRIISSPGMESLFEDALKVAIPEEVARLTAEGDALFAKGRTKAALAKYEAASQTGGGTDPQLLHRTGRCQLKLKRWQDAKKSLRSALKLDPGNEKIRRDYRKAKRGAR
jgi:hypothetical protein